MVHLDPSGHLDVLSVLYHLLQVSSELQSTRSRQSLTEELGLRKKKGSTGVVLAGGRSAEMKWGRTAAEQRLD